MIDLAEGDAVVGPIAGKLLTQEVRILSQFCQASHHAVAAALGRENAFNLIDVQVEPGQDVAQVSDARRVTSASTASPREPPLLS